MKFYENMQDKVLIPHEKLKTYQFVMISCTKYENDSTMKGMVFKNITKAQLDIEFHKCSLTMPKIFNYHCC